jgi:hypothetical protein
MPNIFAPLKKALRKDKVLLLANKDNTTFLTEWFHKFDTACEYGTQVYERHLNSLGIKFKYPKQ